MSFEVLASGYGLVEGPTADRDGSIVFSDVLGGGVYRLAPSGEIATVVPKRRGVGGIALHVDGGVVVSGRDVVHVHEGRTRTVLSVESVLGWNDLCTDAAGRVYAGSIRFKVFDPKAELVPGECWRVDASGAKTELYDRVRHANGIALSPDGRTLYHSDSRAGVILVHDLDEGGRAQGRREIRPAAGQPDGMAIDETGGIWVAMYGAARVDRYRPDGTLDRHVDVPAKQVTSVCFAGSDGRDLIVTTADHLLDASLRGCVLRTRVDVAGAPVHPARL